LAPNRTGEEYGFLNRWRQEWPRKAEKKGRAVSTEDLPFWQNRQQLVIQKKGGNKGGPVAIGLRCVTHVIYNAEFYIIRVRLCIIQVNLAII